MDLIKEAVRARHSVRSFTDEPIAPDTEAALRVEMEACNTASGLHIQLITNEGAAFGSMMARYGKFSGCKNYFAIVGPKGSDEACGYYGERLVLLAQSLGLNSCWVAMTYDKRKVPIQCAGGEQLIIVIALGYGTTQGTAHKSKDMARLCRTTGEVPGWFRSGMEAALLAPTAINQQKFLITLSGKTVSAKALLGPHSKIDLGIVKYHFELGAGVDQFEWA